MTEKKEDRRVRYTKMFLKEALLELMKIKPIEKITPTELCRNANINRNTFYAHYTTPQDLLTEIEDELEKDILQCISIDTNCNFGIDGILRAMREHKELCMVILGNFGDKSFLVRVMDSAQDYTLSKWKEASPSSDVTLLENLFSYCANGSVAVISRWITEGMERDEKEIAKILEFANNSILSATNGKNLSI